MNNPTTPSHNAELPNYSSQPRNMRLATGGGATAPVSRVFPEIRGGVCEHCGILDAYQPAQYQYKLCPHYRGMDMKCMFCPIHADHDEVLRRSKLIVREHPYRPGELVTLCGAFECQQKFEKMFA